MKFLNNIRQEASQFRLSADEKALMRAQIFGAASPVTVQHSPYFLFSYQFRMVMAGVMLFVLAGAGTASAAAGSALPGDILYPIKINVNEAVKVALATTPVAKAVLHAELADVRVEEAQALAVQGKLNASTTQQLAANFDEHAKSAQELTKMLAVSDPAAAVQITTQLDSALSANGAVLLALGDESSSTDTKDNSGLFASRVLAHVGASGRIALADSISMAKNSADSPSTMAFAVTMTAEGKDGSASSTVAVAPTVAPAQKASPKDEVKADTAASIRTKAIDVLAGARVQFVAASSTVDATTTTQLTAQFDAVDALMMQGSAALEAGDSEVAIKNFTEVLSKAVQLRAILKAQVRYDNGVIKSLLNF